MCCLYTLYIDRRKLGIETAASAWGRACFYRYGTKKSSHLNRRASWCSKYCCYVLQILLLNSCNPSFLNEILLGPQGLLILISQQLS
ncbi:hypothetical protein V6N13_021746 [Hibiscus sabdariffa]